MQRQEVASRRAASDDGRQTSNSTERQMVPVVKLPVSQVTAEFTIRTLTTKDTSGSQQMCLFQPIDPALINLNF